MTSINYVAPSYTISNVLWGTASLYTAPEGTSAPDDTDLGAVLADPWVYVGATDQGVKVTWNPKTQDINIEEQAIAVATLIDTVEFTIEASLAEDTLANIQLSYGGGGTLTTTAAASGTPGKQVLQLSDTLPTLAAVLVGANQKGKPRALYVPKVMSAGQVETDFRRVDDKHMYPLTLNGVCKPSEIVITDITDDPTA